MDSEDDQENEIEALKWAFEQGYRQGRNDENEGVFIKWSLILAHFLASLKGVRLQSTDRQNNTLKSQKRLMRETFSDSRR